LKDIEKLSQEELEKVFKRLPEEMQKEEEPTIPFAFKTEAESVPFPVINEYDLAVFLSCAAAVAFFDTLHVFVKQISEEKNISSASEE
jgi:hypothetical protein